MTGEPVRIAVVGTGWWATQWHLPALVRCDGAEVVALVDPDEGKLGKAAAAFGVPRLYTDHRDLFRDGHVDGVVVAAPHRYHYEIARDALDAGVGVLVEKPMTISSADAWDLVESSERTGRPFVVGYTFQFTETARRAREIVASGRLGRIHLVNGHFSSMVAAYLRGRPEEYSEVFDFPLTGPSPSTYSDPEISGGGQGQTQVTHPMGMVFWVTGLRAVAVHAWMENHGAAVDVVDAITCRFDNGGLGTMASSGELRPGQQGVEQIVYHGSEGIMVQDLRRGTLWVAYADGSTEEVVADDAYPAGAPARCLVELLAGRGDPVEVNRAPGRHAAAAVEYLEAAYESAMSGSPVQVRSELP